MLIGLPFGTAGFQSQSLNQLSYAPFVKLGCHHSHKNRKESLETRANGPFHAFMLKTKLYYDHGHNIVRIFDVLPIFPFTTNETKPDY